MNAMVDWIGKYWNAILLFLLVVGAIAIILLWPSRAIEQFSVEVEPHMNPGLSGGSVPGAEWMVFVVGILVVLVLFVVWARWHED